MKRLPKIVQIEVIAPHRLGVRFDDGAVGQWQADLAEFFGPIGEPLCDPAYFARVFVENGALVWPNGFDASPVALYQDLKASGQLVAGKEAAE
jgi:Protein of unknown function (DUF2442)